MRSLRGSMTPAGGAGADPADGMSSAIQNCQPTGGAGHDGSILRPGPGDQPGGTGQFGGGLNRITTNQPEGQNNSCVDSAVEKVLTAFDPDPWPSGNRTDITALIHVCP